MSTEVKNIKKPRAKKKIETNPNGANQYVLDPRQALFFELYLDPKSLTFSNALQSALKAGFSQSYAESLMNLMPSWLSEKLGELNMLTKAERNLDKMLDLNTREPVMTMFGPLKDGITKEVITKENSSLLKVKADVSKFVAERIGKAKYSTGEKGNTVNIQINSVSSMSNEQLEALLKEKNEIL